MTLPRVRSPLPLVLFTIFLDMLGVGILIPIIPLLLADSSSSHSILPFGWDVRTGYILLGFLSASYPLGQFFSAPVFGQLSDRFGRKNILVFSLCGTCISYGVFAWGILTKNIPLLFLSRLCDGITGGNIAVAQAIVADISRPCDRTKTFGLVGAVFGLGFIIGPFLGGRLSDTSFFSWFNAATPFWFAMLLTFFNILFVLYSLPETHPVSHTSLRFRWAQSVHNIVRAFRFPSLRVLFGTVLLFQMGFSFFVSFFGVFLITRFSFTQGNIGDFFAYIGLWIIFTQVYITRLLSSRFREHQVLRFTLFSAGIAIISYLFPTQRWALFLIAPVLSLSNGLTNANLTGLISRSVDASIQGEILGINSSILAFSQTLPPILAGVLAAEFAVSMPLVAAGVMIFASGLLFLPFSFRRTRDATIG